MGNGMLSQEEIDALLSGSDDFETTPEKEVSLESITDIEKDAIGEIANISMGTAATTLSQLVGRRVQITTPRVDLTTVRKIFDEYSVPHVLINVNYKKGINGSNILVLSREDGAIIVDLMMGGMGNPSSDLSEIQISGISEAMNQMMGSAATSMSTMFSSVVDISPPKIYVAETEDEINLVQQNLETDETLVRISFRLVIEDIIDSVMLQVLPLNVAKEMADKLIKQMSTSKDNNSQSSSIHQKNPIQPTETPRYQAPPPPPETNWQPPLEASPPPMGTNGYDSMYNKTQTNFVQQARFSPLSPAGNTSLPSNLGLIFDVPLQVSVELGKATKTIKEILELGPGSVIELNRLAGEPVDMIVNGKLIAKCEVVVINETFGIRITEIISPSDRIIDTLN
ncbi:MAG: flagellar motor switch protein FliN [Gracilibacter sp. BRH_c7a]|nr:MAG: flagellar motor switch protein FliN [Gracilibacter sp. BRH_c7a]